jgi:hypothetical protein
MWMKIKKAKDLNHASFSQGDLFWQLRNYEDMGFQQYENFSHRIVGRDFRYHDDLDKNLGSIKMKISSFQGRNHLKIHLE